MDSASNHPQSRFPEGIWLVLASVVLAAGCASQAQQPTSMRDPEANFSTYKTFGWDDSARTDASGHKRPLPLVETNIRSAITAELTGKGYEPAAEGTTPDLLLAYEASRAETVKNKPFRVGVGVGSWGGSGGGSVGVSSSGVKNVSEGRLVIHAVDLVRKAEVWQGQVQRELGKGGAEPAVVQAAVAEVFQDFPARSQP
jgi:Domain of unknown function (DUF4136)